MFDVSNPSDDVHIDGYDTGQSGQGVFDKSGLFAAADVLDTKLGQLLLILVGG